MQKKYSNSSSDECIKKFIILISKPKKKFKPLDEQDETSN